jgi:cytochrome c oxidase cbb3-type subunit III
MRHPLLVEGSVALLLVSCGGGQRTMHTTVASPTQTGDTGLRTARATAAQYATSNGEVSAPGGGVSGTETGAATAELPDLGTVTSISVGPLAGDAIDPARERIKNPYAGNQSAINEGGQLFIHMNCASCHGFEGGGGMGPALAAEDWRFGGDDADVFNSIYDGRGKGMPAWRDALTEDEIWKLVAFIRTLPDSGARASSHGAPGAVQRPNANAPGDWREPLKGSQEAP